MQQAVLATGLKRIGGGHKVDRAETNKSAIQRERFGMGTKKVLTSKEAAEYLGFSNSTLQVSRSRGELAGVAPPDHIKMGRSIRYLKDDLDKWVSQFKKQSGANRDEAGERGAA